MDAEQFVEAIRSRDAHITALTEYATRLEWMVKEARGETARDEAFTETDRDLSATRSEVGLRTGSLSLR